MKNNFKKLLSPISVGRKNIRNRVLITAHVPGMEKCGLINDNYIAYQEILAKGGAGLQISGASSVHETGGVGPGRGINCYQSEVVDGLRKLGHAVHRHGGRFLMQLGHAAATVNDQDVGKPLIAPSDTQSELIRETPEVMSLELIDEIIAGYSNAAFNVKEGKLDGVEILGAFGYLVGAFMSPLTNHRNDDYGGSFENRMRFPLRVISAVRSAVGSSMIVGLRLPGDEKVEGGLSQSSMKEIASYLTNESDLDYLNVIVGTNYNRLSRMEHWPPTPAPHGLFVNLARAIKTVTDLPVFTTGRITTPQFAETILRRGDADMIGMTRAHIADPNIVRKIEADQNDDIRPCVGANLCISQATEAKVLKCFYNPDVGKNPKKNETLKSIRPKNVVVIGGGPAGLEAARVSANLGHKVTLFEKNTYLGGQLKLWARAPLYREFNNAVSWFELQLNKSQVHVIKGKEVNVEEIKKASPDFVILATGSKPRENTVLMKKNVTIKALSNIDLLREAFEDKHLVLFDEGGGRGGLSAVDHLIQYNKITIVTTDYSIGEFVNPNLRTPIYKSYLSNGVIFRPQEKFVKLKKNSVVVQNIFSLKEKTIYKVDYVTFWKGNVVVDELKEELKSIDVPFSLVGDCRAPRQVHIAVAEGALAARKIGNC